MQVSISEVDKITITDPSTDVVHGDHALQEFLASNTTLHMYKQTAEERMLSMFQELNYAEDTHTYKQALYNARKEVNNTNQSGLAKNERATRIYC
jgi:hypothetical protein